MADLKDAWQAAQAAEETFKQKLKEFGVDVWPSKN
jgi:hypothetical protein